MLKRTAECEYPAEFLVARLLGKKGALFHNWNFLSARGDIMASLQDSPFVPFLNKFGAPGIWHYLRHEYQWVYARMNPDLRTTFAPYFHMQAFQTLLICLRYLAGKIEMDRIKQELHDSMLHEDIQRILTAGMDFAPKLQALEKCLVSFSDLYKGLAERSEGKNMAAVETFLRNSLFASILAQKPVSGLKVFFQYLIDMQNCMTLAKSIRWRIKTVPPLISGGTVPAERLMRAYFRQNLLPVLRFLKCEDRVETPVPQKLETALLHFITSRLKSGALQGSVVGVILFYQLC